tara:strand:+ start:257 stop:3571 length:3315 start_codon:yes stop_codon:yes gene_type:complete
MTFKIKLLLIVAVITLVLSSCTSSKRDVNPEKLTGGLELLSSEQTGIDFNNTIKETSSFNHFYFGHIYNGSGVAIGDLNNDGLQDIFFAGNQVTDRLFLNKGSFKFEDITKKSKISKTPGWSWGVTMADVNADGYLDIYVSRNGNSLDSEKRKNQLFINNKDLTFTESADAFGLADMGFSSQAVFFDMDNDGDLDMYQVNQPADKKLFLLNKIPKKDYSLFRDRIYRNVNGKFIDVSKEVGISRNFGYGLSVNASDFNNDGWIDLYVANDYAEPDFMYYNNGDGTFKNVINEKLKHITQLSMGSDTGDINNDGNIDLFTTDMTPEDHYRSKTNMASMSTDRFESLVKAGAHRQYMSNTLQINTGSGSFSDIANIAGISSTDWSWASLLVDLDNDGWKDIIVSNGIKRDVENNDYLSLLKKLDRNTTAEQLFEISKSAPSVPISNYIFKNTGGFKFEKLSKKWGFDTPSFSSGMAYGDLDNDGDLDVVVNNMEQNAFVYENKTTGNFLKFKLIGSKLNKFGYGAKAIIYHNGNKQIAENIVTRGYFSSVESGLFFGLGTDVKVESVEIIWPDGKVNYFENVSANKTITANYSKAKLKIKEPVEIETLLSKIDAIDIGLDYIHKENKFNDFKEEILLPHKLSINGPFSATADVNGDNLDDVFIGGAAQQEGVLFLQTKEGKFQKSLSNPWSKDKDSEDLEALFFDLDGDGDNDLYVASGGSEFKSGNKLLKDRVYINDGVGNFSKSFKALPNIYKSSQTVEASDIDGDGDLDLFIGTRLIPGKYTFPATSYILINENGILKEAPKEVAPDLTNIGMVTDAVFSDIDNDNDDDLLIVGEWMEIKILENNKGFFTDNAKKFGINSDTRGIWWSITKDDLDNDGDDDYILGNLGKNNKFKATKEHPFKVYANDFDGNGTNDVVLAKYYKDGYVPMRGRECTTQQMPYVGKKFKDFHSFASSKLIDILPEKTVKEAVVLEISNFESILLVNENGKLTAQKLPIQAQISPIKNSFVDDFNKDGFKDILLVGNHYGVEVETVRYDAGYGSILLGDGKNKFKFLPPSSSGFYIPTDSRAISSIKTINNSKMYLVTNNNDSIALFKNNMELMSN